MKIFERARQRRAGVLLAMGALVISLIAGGCGSSSKASPKASSSEGGGRASVPVSAELSTAYQQAIDANSASVAMDIDVASKKETVQGTGSGAFDWTRKVGQMAFSFDVAGKAVQESLVLDGTDIYLKLPSQVQSQTGGKPWIKLDLSSLEGGSSGASPDQVLSVLTANSSSVTRVGSATVNGVPTTEYRATIDPSKAAAHATPAAQKAFAELKDLGTTSFPMDVWIDREGRPAQMRFAVTLTSPPAGESQAAAAFPVTTTFQMDLSDWGQPVSVTVPPASEVSQQSIPGLSS